MRQSTDRFDRAVETFQNSSDMSEAEAEVYVMRTVERRSRSHTALELEKSESTVDTQYQAAKKKAKMPAIETVKRVAPLNTGHDHGTAYEIWFENGAMMRYVWDESWGEIFEQTFTADDPHSVHEEMGLTGSEEELAEYALEAISEYTRTYRDDPEACRKDWSPVFEAITLYRA